MNVSCDSLRPDRYAAIRRRGSLAPVLDAMDDAERAGLAPLKVNVVLMAGVNDDEVFDFAEFAAATGRIVRFIEFMPLDGDGTWRRDQVVPAAEVVERIDERWALEAVPVEGVDASAPAERFRFVDGGGEIGVIASVTRPFCGTCDRLRLTADGAVATACSPATRLPCAACSRAGAGDDEIARLLREAVWAKLPGHGINGTHVHPAHPLDVDDRRLSRADRALPARP